MKKVMLLILVLVLTHTYLFAQVVTAVAPLKPGNKWVYYSKILSSGEITTYEVLDSVKTIKGIQFYAILTGPYTWVDYMGLLNNGFYARYEEGMTDSLYKYFKINPQKWDTWEQRRSFDTTALHSTIIDTFIAQVFDKNTTIYVIDRFMIVDDDTVYNEGSREFWTKEFGMLSGLYEQAEDDLLGCVIDGVVYGDTSTVGVDEEEQLPTEFVLYQNYPNPFNPLTNIKFSLPKESEVSIKIYNTIGKEIIELINETRSSGDYEIVWNGTDKNGNKVSSGVYFITMEANSKNSVDILFHKTIKSILIK